MKATVLTIALLIPMASMAEGLTEESCVVMASLAGKIMEARQAGVTMARSLEIANDTEAVEGMPKDVQDAFVKFQKMTISEAYRQPRYHTEEAQQRATTEFENSNLRACLRVSSE